MSDEWFQAVDQGDTEAILDMLRRGADVNLTVERVEVSALMLAVSNKQLDLIEVLLEHGANIQLVDGAGYTAMTRALISSLALDPRYWGKHCPDPRPLDLLLAAGGQFGLFDSVYLNDLNLARACLDEGADVNTGDRKFHGPVLMAAAQLGHLEMIALLLDRGANIEAIDDLKNSSLMSAAKHGQLEAVRLLLDRGARLNPRDWLSCSALTKAAVEGHRDIVDLLIAREAYLGIIESVALKDEALLEEALEEEDELEWLNKWVNALYTLSGSSGSPRIVELLLDRGAIKLDDPAHMAEAARCGDREILRLLLDRGADINALERDLTPLDWAIREGRDEAATFLEGRGARRGPVPFARDDLP